MSIKPTLTLILNLLILLHSTSDSSASAPVNTSNSTLSAYEVLEDYDFPIGILPNGVLGYELNSSTGAFKAYLNSTCTFSIDSYTLKYKSTISGYISTDKLTSLSGVYVKIYWFWLSITKVTRNDDELVFSVSVSSSEFPVSSFDECPTCGCGFDCESVNGEKSLKMRLKSLVSSSWGVR